MIFFFIRHPTFKYETLQKEKQAYKLPKKKPIIKKNF